MATPYSTPGYPSAPKPTPSSAVMSSRSALRAPIHNPFDKFTQPEFDAWIGDITGALKRALGREDPPPISTPVSQHEDVHPADVSAYGEPDDSFAEIKARRAAKGKERAREEDLSENENPSSPEVVIISSDEEDQAGDDLGGEGDDEEYDEDIGSNDEPDRDEISFSPEPVYDVSDEEDGAQEAHISLDDLNYDEVEDEGPGDDEDINDAIHQSIQADVEEPEYGADEYDEDIDEEELDEIEEDNTYGRNLTHSSQNVHEVIEVEDDEEDGDKHGNAGGEGECCRG